MSRSSIRASQDRHQREEKPLFATSCEVKHSTRSCGNAEVVSQIDSVSTYAERCDCIEKSHPVNSNAWIFLFKLVRKITRLCCPTAETGYICNKISIFDI